MDVSTTWCGPCWLLHHDWHYLEDWYEEFGPNGTDQVVFLFYEADEETTMADMNGTGTMTQGDWVTGTPYPMFNEAPLFSTIDSYINGGFPTVNIICPSDKKIKYDLWSYWSSPETMREKIIEVINECADDSGTPTTENPKSNLSIFPNPINDLLTVQIESKIKQKINLEICDLTGKVINSTAYVAVEGKNKIEIESSILQAGTYFLNVTTEIDDTSQVLSFVKK